MGRPRPYSEGHDRAVAPARPIHAPAQDATSRRIARRTPWGAISCALVVFMLVNIVVQVCQPYVMRLASYDFQYSPLRVADYYLNPRPDVIFLGSSRALEGFVPQVVNREVARSTGRKIRSLNLGITGSSVELNYLLLKNLIEAHKQPRAIVYGFSEFELDPDFAPLRDANVPYFQLYLRPDDFARYAGPSVQDKASFLLSTLCPLCRDATLIRSALSIALNPDDPSHKYYAPGPSHHDPLPGGMSIWLGPSVGTKKEVQQNYFEYGDRLRHYHVSTRRVALLNDFLVLARKRGIQIVLVNMPVTPQLRSMWHSTGAIQRYDSLVRRIVRRNHATFLDLYRGNQLHLPASDFLDLHHLNLIGATILSRMVARRDIAPLFRDRASTAR